VSNQGFIALHRGEDAETLLARHPNAFLLLTQIALRAQWKDNPITGMKAGEAFIGDYQNAGIPSRKAYRVAQEILARTLLVRFKGANKGTVATLIDTRIFSITAPDRGQQGANKGPSEGHQGATTHKDTLKDGHTETPLPLPIPPAEKKKSKPKDGGTFSQEGIQFAQWFKSSLPETMNLPGNWQETWAKAHDDLVRLDGRTPEEIKAVCQWARTDDFWKTNFMSPAKLRDRNRDKITYYDVFAEKMKASAPRTQGQSGEVNLGRRQKVNPTRGIQENIPLD